MFSCEICWEKCCSGHSKEEWDAYHERMRKSKEDMERANAELAKSTKVYTKEEINGTIELIRKGWK
jgi:hypothetical protein